MYRYNISAFSDGSVNILFAAHLEELEQLLKGVAMMKELTLRTKDYLVSFGECMSTRIFAAYLNTIGVKARQVCCFLITCTCSISQRNFCAF